MKANVIIRKSTSRHPSPLTPLRHVSVHETQTVNDNRVSCDGLVAPDPDNEDTGYESSSPAFAHPKVFLRLSRHAQSRERSVSCPYCGRRFVQPDAP